MHACNKAEHMEIAFKRYISSPTTFSPFACCPTHFAICHENNIKLFEIILTEKIDFNQEILLEGHHRSINALQFVTIDSEESLVSAGSDYVIIWHLHEVNNSYKNGEMVRGHILCSIMDVPHQMGFFNCSSLLSIAFDHYVLVVNAKCDQSDKILANIEEKCLSCIEFLDESNMITVSCNGQIVLIDFKKNDDLSRKIIHCVNSSLTSLATLPFQQCFAVGSSNLMVCEFAYDEKLGQFKLYMKVDLSERQRRVSEDKKMIGDRSSGHVVALSYVQHSADAAATGREENERFLLCATEQAVYMINCINSEVHVHGFRDDKDEAVLVRNVTFLHLQNDGKILCTASCLLQSKIMMLSINLPKVSDSLDLSFISTVPLLPTSPLNTSCKVNKANKPKNDRPVTFKTQIKSSGYTAAPRMTTFKPKTVNSRKKVNVSKPSVAPFKPSIPDNPVDWSKVETVCERVVLCPGDVNVNNVAINERSGYVACALSNASVHVAKLPLENFNKRSKVITGHSQSVAGCHWSHDNDFLLTYTSNREVKLWSPPYTNEPNLSFQAESSDKIPKDLVHAQFYYLDKFILNCVGNWLSLYKYALNEGTKDDVKRYLNKSKCKVVGNWQIGTAQNITCMTSPNAFYSYVVLACGSDRSICVFDFNSCKEVKTFNDVHTRPAHALRHSTPFSSSSSERFITAAAGDGIKLWDLRTQICVRKFHQHQCATKCDVAFSGCENFVAAVTDHRSVCIYDIRKPFPLQEINRRSKAVSLSFTENATKLLIGDDSSTLDQIKCA